MKAVYSALCILFITYAPAAVWSEGGIDDHAPVQYERKNYTEEMHISRGGQLYDDRLRTNPDAEKPQGEHPLWKNQDTNRRSGYTTFRCKECHGWDYLGSDGALIDVLVYSRTLPQDEPNAGWLDLLLESLGIGKKNQESYIPDRHRGFGPRKQPDLP